MNNTENSQNPPAMQARTCAMCDTMISGGNKSGFCKRHIFKGLAADPAFNEKRRAAIKATFAVDPVKNERRRETMRRNGMLPQARAARSRAAKQIGLSAIGTRARREKPGTYTDAAKRCSATRLAWCPPELRELYRHLIRSKRYHAEEARALVLETHERDMAIFRRRMLAL